MSWLSLSLWEDDGCDHVICSQADCKIDFCFSCSAIRSPIMTHGNHYHRPNCSFYSYYNGDDDRYDEKCIRCKLKRSLCEKPKNLKEKCRFQEGEW